jgi:hypothetical protein
VRQTKGDWQKYREKREGEKKRRSRRQREKKDDSKLYWRKFYLIIIN